MRSAAVELSSASDLYLTSPGIVGLRGDSGITLNPGSYSLDITGELNVTDSITAGSTIFASGGLVTGPIGSDLMPSSDSNSSTSGLKIGDASNKWRNIYLRDGNYTGSDMRIKKLAEPLDERAYKFIMSLNGLEYTLIGDDDNKRHWGFYAQEVKKAIDGCGYVKDQAVYQHEDEDNLCLNYQEIIAPLVKTVQIQQNRIDELEAEIEYIKTT